MPNVSESDRAVTAWDDFIRWVARFYNLPEFDADEREYKLAIADKVRSARDAFRANKPDWLEQLRSAFAPPNNLTNWRTHDIFLKWADQEREEADRALRAIWRDGSDLQSRLDGFLAALPKETASGPSKRLSIASFLLLAENPYDYPIFRTEPFRAGFKFTGYPPAERDTTDTQRYLHALAFLDRVIEEAAARGLTLRDRLDAQSVVWSVHGWQPDDWPDHELQALVDYRAGRLEARPMSGPTVAVDGGTRVPPPINPHTLTSLATDLHLPASWLEDVHTMLKAKGQVIFHGPPGTGKTYVAMRLAEHLAGSKERVSIVQFHPSYAYEDFVEGYRPAEINGRPGFKRENGPLVKIAEAALANPDVPHVLIIDEINRGNVARVFGELYFLLEYRGSKIELQYSQEPFALPENLWIIGTMNTADRSIALIDAALRRRFFFVPFFPSEEPIKGLLRRWLGQTHPDMTWIADVVDRANEHLGDRHASIGPSYFMRRDLDETWVRLIWEHQVLPYLEEHFFGEPERLRDFALDELRREAASAAEPDETDADPSPV